MLQYKEIEMRQLTDHIVHGGGVPLRIDVSQSYDLGQMPNRYIVASGTGEVYIEIEFHVGPTDRPRGLTNEVLAAILIDRMKCAQEGKFACNQNAEALGHLIEALDCWKSRTKYQMLQGIEGTQQP